MSKPSELAMNQLHAAVESSAKAARDLDTLRATLEEQGPATLANAIGTLRGTASALNQAIYALYESEQLGL